MLGSKKEIEIWKYLIWRVSIDLGENFWFFGIPWGVNLLIY